VSQARRTGLPLWARIASGWGAFLALLLIVWAGTPLIVPIYLLLATIGLVEYATMLRLRGMRIHLTTLLAVMVLLLPAALPNDHLLQLVPAGWTWSRETLALLFSLAILALSARQPHRNALSTVTYSLLGFIWIPLFLSYAIDIRELPGFGFSAALLTVFAIVAADVGGFVAGRAWGRRALAPEISPDKTIEGAIGGLVLAIVVTVITSEILSITVGTPLQAVAAGLFGGVVAFAAQVGDLFESGVKRWVGVKDTGVFLPGHGGVLDRIDSHLFGIPVAYLLLQLTMTL